MRQKVNTEKKRESGSVKRKTMLWVRVALLLVCALGLRCSIKPARALYASNLTVNPVWSDAVYIIDDYPLYHQYIHLWANVTNTGKSYVLFKAGSNITYIWWYVHESYVNSFIANQGNPTNSHPYWELISIGWLQFNTDFNWTVGYTKGFDYLWYVGFRTEPFLQGNYYICFEFEVSDQYPHDNSPFYSESLWPGLYTIIRYGTRQGVGGVGGVWAPVDKFGLLAPYIGLESTITVAAVVTAVYVRRVKRRNEK
jgi:hypothetical protein